MWRDELNNDNQRFTSTGLSFTEFRASAGMLGLRFMSVYRHISSLRFGRLFLRCIIDVSVAVEKGQLVYLGSCVSLCQHVIQCYYSTNIPVCWSIL